MAQVSLRLDDNVKTDADAILGRLGLTLTSAINIFLRQVIVRHGIPFVVQEDDPFYHPANIAHLNRVMEDWKNGARNFHYHELLPDE